jgi:hypothetical protein
MRGAWNGARITPGTPFRWKEGGGMSIVFGTVETFLPVPTDLDFVK